jgi:hypothetical protein
MSFPGQFSLAAGRFRILLDSFILTAVHGKRDVPQPMSASSAHTKFLPLHLKLVSGHEVHRDYSKPFLVQHRRRMIRRARSRMSPWMVASDGGVATQPAGVSCSKIIKHGSVGYSVRVRVLVRVMTRTIAEFAMATIVCGDPGILLLHGRKVAINHGGEGDCSRTV